MLKRIWQQLVRFFRWLFRIGTPPQPSPNQEEETNSPSPFNQEGLQGGELSQSLTEGEKVVVTPAQHQELTLTMVQWGEIERGELEEVAQGIDWQLLESETPTLQDTEEFLTQSVQPSQAGDDDTAVACVKRATELAPTDYKCWLDQGDALFNLGEFEQALAAYDKALELQPDNPDAWSNRGVLLRKLGEFEQALTSYDKALAIRPDNPEAWSNRGLPLRDLGEFEQALTSYDIALEIQPNFHIAWNNRGAVLYDLEAFEQAIASFDNALKIKPDYPTAWIGRGITAYSSRHCQTPVALSLPLGLQNPDLDKRGYDGALAIFQEGLKFCHQETHPEGWGCLHQAIGNVHYWRGRGESTSKPYWYKAANRYKQALITLTEDKFPELHLEVLQDYIKPLVGLGQLAEAEELRRQGTDLLQRLLSDPKYSADRKKQLALKFVSFQQFAVDRALESHQLLEALELAEKGKNACLSWLLDAYSEEISSPSYTQIQQLLNPTTAIIYWHLSPTALTTFILKHNAPSPIVISTQDNSVEAIDEMPLPESLQRLHKLEDWVRDWNEQYSRYRQGRRGLAEPALGQSWLDNLPETIGQLSEILNISAVLSELDDISHLILIPHRDLHRFPLHALFPDTFTITYLPSAQIGLALSNSPLSKATETQHQLLSVGQCDRQSFDPLPYAEIESAAITLLFDNSKRIVGEDATKTEVKAALLAEYSIFHFTDHGTYDFNRPSQSSLILAGSNKLSLAEICRLPLSSYKLVTLSACETAIIGNQSITTDYVGLVSGFMRAGVSYVLSTLWTVESEASALMTMKFYHLLNQDKAEPIAFAEAQKWLRQATWGEIKNFYQNILTSLPTDAGNLRPLLEDAVIRVSKMEAHYQPFTHPYHWAAFTITGLSC